MGGGVICETFISCSCAYSYIVDNYFILNGDTLKSEYMTLKLLIKLKQHLLCLIFIQILFTKLAVIPIVFWQHPPFSIVCLQILFSKFLRKYGKIIHLNRLQLFIITGYWSLFSISVFFYLHLCEIVILPLANFLCTLSCVSFVWLTASLLIFSPVILLPDFSLFNHVVHYFYLELL